MNIFANPGFSGVPSSFTITKQRVFKLLESSVSTCRRRRLTSAPWSAMPSLPTWRDTAQLVTHHFRAGPWATRSRGLPEAPTVDCELGNYLTWADRAVEQRLRLTVINHERPWMPPA